MMSPSFWNETWTVALINHLWQSTVVVLMAWLLALTLRKNHAKTRYWVWMIASLKFLVPFSLLIAAGESLRVRMVAPIQQPAFANVMEQFTQPFAQTASHATATAAYAGAAPAIASRHAEYWPLVFLAIWLCGALFIVFSWTRSWWKIRSIVRASSPMTLLAEVPVLSSPNLLEPGIFGIVRPVLLLPKGIDERLTSPQLSTIIAHEMCHVRRRDNLTATLHMLVAAIFWFHPAAWWIKARLLEERERACDEAVLQSGNDAPLYAESILNVCKFYLESPLACVSGITGADLKRRIVHIMAEQAAHKLDLSRKLLLCLAGIVAVAMPVVFGLVHINHVHAQTTVESSTGITGTWQGTLKTDRDLRIVLKLSKNDGKLKAVLYPIDDGAQPVTASSATLVDSTFKAELGFGNYEGTLSADGTSITGNLSRGGNPLPLNLVRATQETAWEIPAFVPQKEMPADADPSFEVATIKPNDSGAPNMQRLGFIGHNFTTLNSSLGDLIAFAYGVQSKQILGVPDWVGKDRYDIAAIPVPEGMPTPQQSQIMIQKLLADRFQLKFHHDKRELSAFVLTVGKDGPKLSPAQSDGPNRGFGMRPAPGGLTIPVVNVTMTDFTGFLQMMVLDRPVVDQTGLSGRFDFNLTFAPDDSQFHGHVPIAITKAPDGAEEPPGFFEAIQRLGLKLEAKKTPTDVLVIDHVEKPSAN
jgi:uncharacterized protein (TIGR03435 family)